MYSFFSTLPSLEPFLWPPTDIRLVFLKFPCIVRYCVSSLLQQPRKRADNDENNFHLLIVPFGMFILKLGLCINAFQQLCSCQVSQSMVDGRFHRQCTVFWLDRNFWELYDSCSIHFVDVLYCISVFMWIYMYLANRRIIIEVTIGPTVLQLIIIIKPYHL